VASLLPVRIAHRRAMAQACSMLPMILSMCATALLVERAAQHTYILIAAARG